MPIFGWVRDAHGLWKDMQESRKTRLEIKKLELEDEKQERLITPATVEDVKKYDPKAQKLDMMEAARRKHEEIRERDRWKDREERMKQIGTGKGGGCAVLLLLVLLLAASVLFAAW